MIKLVNTKSHYAVNVPTKKSDIDFEKLKDVVKNVVPSEHYAIIALCQSFNPFSLAMLGTKTDKNAEVRVSSYFVKSNDPNNKINANAGDKISISRTDIEMSTHLYINFSLSTSSIATLINDCPEVRTMLRNGCLDENNKIVNEIICVEFKLVPLSAIKAVFKNDIKNIDSWFETIDVN